MKSASRSSQRAQGPARRSTFAWARPAAAARPSSLFADDALSMFLGNMDIPFLTGTIRSLDQLDADDWRRSNPRFEGDNLEANIRIVEQVDDVTKQLGATPAQVALAWLLAQGDDIAPIPGTRRIANLEQNVVADELVLSAGQLERLSEVAVPVGDRYADMSRINR